MEPGDRLKLLIRASGKTQARIARDMGENSMWISNRVTGHSQINVQDVPKLAAPLGWDVCDLFLALIGEREPWPDQSPLNEPPTSAAAHDVKAPLSPGAQEIYDEIRAVLKERLGESAAETASTIVDFIQWQTQRHQRDQQQQWPRLAVKPDTPERG